MASNDKPSGRTPPTAAGVNSELNRLTQRVGELQKLGSTSRRITLVLVVIVVAQFAIFSYFTVNHVQGNFNPDDLQKAVAQHVPMVTPEIRARLQAVAEHTLPVYRAKATERFQKVGPEVARDALARLEKIPEENGDELKSQLRVALDASIKRLEPELKKEFPNLSDDQKLSIVHQQFLGAIDKENDGIAAHVTTISNSELQNMKQVLEKFDVPGDTSPASHRLREREFLHALVDVMMDSDVTLQPTAKPTTQPAMKTASAAPAPTTAVSAAVPAAQ